MAFEPKLGNQTPAGPRMGNPKITEKKVTMESADRPHRKRVLLLATLRCYR
jgi:hypothetical protein